MPRVTCDLLEAFHSKISSIEINVEEKMRKCPSVCGKDRPLIQSQLTLQEMESENSLELAMLKTQIMDGLPGRNCKLQAAILVP